VAEAEEGEVEERSRKGVRAKGRGKGTGRNGKLQVHPRSGDYSGSEDYDTIDDEDIDDKHEDCNDDYE